MVELERKAAYRLGDLFRPGGPREMTLLACSITTVSIHA